MKTNITATKSESSLQKGAERGFTLAEVVISVAIAALLFGGMITAYVNATRNAEWTGYSLAAGALAIQQLEQARSAIWDPVGSTPKNEINLMMQGLNSYSSNSSGVLTGYSWTNLDMPTVGGNFTRATNFVTVTPFSPAANVQMEMIQIQTVWPFPIAKTYQLYTNTIVTYLAPDNTSVTNL